MKRKIFFTLFLIFTIALMSLVSMSVYADEKPITLTFATWHSPGELGGKFYSIFKEEIEERSNGKVQFKIYWHESLLKGKEILKGVEDGVVDMGVINGNLYPNQMPIASVFGTIVRGPVGFDAQMMAYNRVMEETQGWKEEYLSHNQIPLSMYSFLNKAVFSSKKTVTLEDFKNQKMRASSRWVLDLMGGAGGVPVSIPWTDCYMAIQTGTIHAVLSNFDGMYNTKLYEVAPNILFLEGLFCKPPMVLSINKDVWNNYPEEIKRYIKEAFEATQPRFKEISNAEAKRVVEGLNEEGCVVNTMSMEDMEKFLTLPVVDEIQAQWIKDMKEAGVENAEELLYSIRNIIDDAAEKEVLDN